ncbi:MULTISPECIES: DNA replication/repair protein RecF [unclassified Psychrobacter]|uniref:DNA replication/repair protein RecF n=1 Tax=unclassified Psychrobacter TaxID=196806 RepID=UPI0018F332B3|nr:MULTISPECIES: DNA replication and repair protein RecF [unclassified Psychrobacter]
MIERLHVSQLRNIRQATLSMSKCNVIIGANGSGKTSLLEAIFLLSRGKSFRHHQPKRYIQHHQPTATVHASLSDGSSLAIQKNTDASTLLRLNHNTVYNQSILTEQLPTLLIDPSSMDMLEQGSASRRQLLDWLAFHMKQAFHPQWVAYQRLLKQRNSVLKRSRSLNANQLAELQAWDAGLSNHAALIHHYRQHLFDAWQPYFAEAIDKLLPAYSGQLQLSYQAGFDTSRPLDEQLSERLEQDSQLGYTRIGSHRADIHVHWREGGGALGNIKEQAANVLSRGEKKLLITALRLSQLPLLLNHAAHDERYANTRARPTPVVLLDDVTAELDARAIDILLTTLAELPCQVVLTSLTQEILPQVQRYWQMPRLFHVKQGVIKHTDKPTESTALS